MSKLVTIYGGSGFVGRYIVQRMAHQGWRVRVAVRRPNEALSLRAYGAVGQVEPVLCNIRDDASVRDVMIGADAVVNCVGILVESGKNSFDAVHHQGAERIARMAREQRVEQLVHISALGADEAATSEYARSKARGEAALLSQFPKAIILRPSVIFGPEDQFFNKFARLSQLSPVIPLVGADSLMQPVYVDDVAAAANAACSGAAKSGIYELGGPDIHSLRDLVKIMLGIIQRRRLIFNMPIWMGMIVGGWFDLVQKMTFGLFTNTILTRDQVNSLRSDSVVHDGMPGFEALGIDPTAMESVLPDYLWVYRPSGQFAAIKASAKNLKI